MMRFKNMLNLFSKTEVQEDKTHPTPPLEKEGVSISCAEHTEKNLFTYLPIHLFTFKKAAFTLAEVLITLGIIGVVAALTLPTLIANHQKQTYVTGLKKAYANLQNAFAKMAYDEGVTDWKQTSCANVGIFSCSISVGGANLDASEACIENIKKQIKYVSVSKKEDNDLSGNSGILFTLVSIDGMIYSFDYDNASGSGGYVDENGDFIDIMGIGTIDIDVNGDKGPNKFGRDRFEFNVDRDKNKIIPVGTATHYNYQTFCTTANANAGDFNAKTCTAKVLIEGKMDY